MAGQPHDMGGVTAFDVLPRLNATKHAIAQLPPRSQLTIPLLCAAAFGPFYNRYVAKASQDNRLSPIIDRLWALIEGGDIPSQEIDELDRRCNGLGEALQDDSEPFFWDAVSAIGTVALAIKAFKVDMAANSAAATETMLDWIRRRLWIAFDRLHPHASLDNDELAENTIQNHLVYRSAIIEIASAIHELSFVNRPTRAWCQSLASRFVKLLQQVDQDFSDG